MILSNCSITLVPEALVIPAQIVCVKVAVVRKFVGLK